MATRTLPTSPEHNTTTLLQIWEHHYAANFAAGVALLLEHKPDAVTKRTLWRLQQLAATGGYVNRYEMGKLTEALQRVVINPTPGPSPIRRGDATATVEAAVVGTVEADVKSNTKFTVENTAKPTVEQSTETSTEQSTVNSTSPLPSGEGLGVGSNPESLTSDTAKALHKRQSHLHALLTAATTDAERARISKEIMEDIAPALDVEYDRLRALKSGAVTEPPPAAEPASAPSLTKGNAADFKKLQSVRSRISRLKNELIPAAKDAKRKTKLEKELSDKIQERERLEKMLA